MSKVKDKERIIKSSKRKTTCCLQGEALRLFADFSAETLQARRLGMIHSKC